MHHIAFALVATTLIFAGCATNSAKFVERRQNVTYYAPDWTHADMHQKVDVAPQPVGGMAAFVKRLDYPSDLRRRHVTGVMRVRVSLDATGRVLSAQVIQAVDPVLDAIVLRAVQQTKWEPAVRGGKPVPLTFRFPITFRV